MAATKKKTSKKVMDVAHPGKSTPAATSKPIIITNRPIMKDPMMAEENEPAQEATAPTLPHKSTPTKVIPLSEPTDPAEVKENAEPTPEVPDTVSTDAPQEAVAPAEPEVKETPQEKEPATKPAPVHFAAPESEEAPSDDTPAPSLTPDEELEAAATKATERDAALQKLVDSKQFFLPINSVEKRRTKRVVVIGILLSIVLVLLWLDVALDANLIQIPGINPVTHFFSS